MKKTLELKRSKVFNNFGPNVEAALREWRAIGYTVDERMGRLYITNGLTELVACRWQWQAQLKLIKPIQLEKNVLLVLGTVAVNPSAETVAAINELLAVAEKENRKLPESIRQTYSSDWRELINNLETGGFVVSWQTGLLQIHDETGDFVILVSYWCGNWTITAITPVGRVHKPSGPEEEPIKHNKEAIAAVRELLDLALEVTYPRGDTA